MNKLRKVIAYAVLLAFIVALFATLDMSNNDLTEKASALTSEGKYSVFYLHDGGKSWTQDDTNWVSSVTGYAAENIDVTVKTLKEISDSPSQISNADLIVIDASDRSGTGAAYLSWNAAYTIFKKVAGMYGDGKAAKFLISTDAYGTSATGSKSVTIDGTGTLNYRYRLGSQGLTFTDGSNIASAEGSNKNLVKLFMMLCTYSNPVTFNSLFFATDSTEYGINVATGALKGYGSGKSGENSLIDGYEYGSWSLAALKPYYIMSSEGADLSSLGYRGSFSVLTEGYNLVGISGAYFKGSFANFRNNVGSNTSKLVSIITDGDALSYRGNVRILAVVPDYDIDAGSIGVDVNRSLTLDMYAAFGGRPAEGVLFEMMSMYEFNTYKDDLNECYDAIVFCTDYGTSYTTVKDAYGIDGSYAKNGSKQGNDLVYYDSSSKNSKLTGFKGDVYYSPLIPSDTNLYEALISASNSFNSITVLNNVEAIAAETRLTMPVSNSLEDSGITLKLNVQGPYDGVFQFQDGCTLSGANLSSLSSINIELTIPDATSYDAWGTTGTLSGDKLTFTNGTIKGAVKASGSVLDISEATINGKRLNIEGTGNFKAPSSGGSTGPLDTNMTVNSSSDEAKVIKKGLNRIVDTILDRKNGLSVFKTPTLYAPENYFNVGMANQNNGEADFFYIDHEVSDEDYINGNGREKALNFTVCASGIASSYRCELYLDLDMDGKYTFVSKVDLSANVKKSITYSSFDDDFAGSIPWKLVLKSSDGSVVYDSYSGYSACKTDTKKKINILQIVTDSSQNEFSGTNTSLANNAFYIPTAQEIALAETNNGKITDNSKYKPDNNERYQNLLKYFDECITVDFVSDKAKESVSGFEEAKWNRSSVTVKYSGDNKTNAIVSNAGIFYYFMTKTKGYDIDATRISMMDLDIIFGAEPADNAKKAKRNALIEKYGISYNSDGSIRYKNSNGESVYCDLLVAGFSSSMVRKFNDGVVETVNENTVNMISGYLRNNRNALLGHGIVSSYGDNLTEEIRELIGMSNKYTIAGTVTNLGNSGSAQAYKINDGSLTKYPYTIPICYSATNTSVPILQLNESLLNGSGLKQLIAYFSNSAYGGRGTATGWNLATGNGVGDYFLYKYGSITYINIGHTEGNALGQKAMTLKLPEALLVVNSIVNTGGTNPTPQDDTKEPDIEIDNADKSIKEVPIHVQDDKDSTKSYDKKEEIIQLYVDYEVGNDKMDSTAMGGNGYTKIGPETYIKDGVEVPVTYEKVVFTGENGPAKVTFKNSLGDEIEFLKIMEYDASTNEEKEVDTIESDKQYYVYIPLNDSVYNGESISGCGLDSRDSFKINIEIEPATNPTTEKTTFKQIVISRRGLFQIN